jgi:hypothetical protein
VKTPALALLIAALSAGAACASPLKISQEAILRNGLGDKFTLSDSKRADGKPITSGTNAEGTTKIEIVGPKAAATEANFSFPIPPEGEFRSPASAMGLHFTVNIFPRWKAAIEWYAGAVYDSKQTPVATFKRDNRILTMKRDDTAGLITLHAAGE